MSKASKSSSSKITAAQRENEAIELRRRGKTFQEIGDELGITRQGAKKAVDRAVKKLVEETQDETEKMRILESARLDKLMDALWDKAMDGDEKAVDKILRISDRRAKLFGLDGPVKVAPTDPSGDKPYEPITDEERAARLGEIMAEAMKRKEKMQELQEAEEKVG